MIRQAAHQLAGILGAPSVARALMQQRLLVVCYHGVCGNVADVPDPAGVHVPAKQFEQQILALLRHYRPVSLADVQTHCLSGTALPPRPILITFDDGYRNVAHQGLPILRRLGVPCVLFIVAGAVESRGWLWTAELDWRMRGDPQLATIKKWLKGLDSGERRRWLETELAGNGPLPECDSSLLNWGEMARILEAGGVAIGSHGLSHAPLTTCSPTEVQTELQRSRELISERLSAEAHAVAYPNGDCSPLVATMARECGYCLGFTTAGRHVDPMDEPLALPRILVGRWDSPPILASRLSGWTEMMAKRK